MNNIKIHTRFIMSEADIEALDKLPANSPTVALTVGQKKLIEGIYFKYIGKNGIVTPKLLEIYTLVMARKWPDKERMASWAAMRIVLNQLLELQKMPVITIHELAKMYKGALTLDEEYRALLQKVYDF